MKTTFDGEVQFAGYADGSRGGPRITFRLTDREHLNTFAGLEGKRFMLAIVEIGDDEKPAAPAPAAKRERMGPLLELAVKLCRDPRFQQWAADRWESGDLSLVVHPEEVVPKTREEWAKYVLCLLCEVSSRKDIDGSVQATRKFHELVRKPYAAWLERRGVSA